MDLENMTLAEVEARIAELDSEVRAAEDPEAVEKAVEERKALNERREELREIEARNQKAAELQNGAEADRTIEERKEKKMAEVNYRESLEYGKAFLRGIKTGDFAECRALMTVNGTVGSDPLNSATIPVPTFLDNEIKNAWEEHQIAGKIKKTYQKGIVKAVFEVSATGAEIHVEGTAAPGQEKIEFGSVELKPANIKKWITVTDEAIEGTTIDTVGYLYRELAHKIVEKAEEEIVNNITTAQVATDATHPGVPEITANPDVDTVLVAEALLSAKAKDLSIMMNRQTYPMFVKLALKAGYAIDVFDGLKDKILFSDKYPAFSAASVGEVYMSIGDLGYGYQANFPAGNDVTIKRDDLSLAEFDLVKLVGKQYVGHGVVAPKAFVNVKKAATV